MPLKLWLVLAIVAAYPLACRADGVAQARDHAEAGVVPGCRNNCSGAGQCTNGTCICELGYTGVDDIAAANDCHVSKSVQLALHIVLGCVSALALCAALYNLGAKLMCKREADKKKVLLYVHVLVYAASCMQLSFSRVVEQYSFDMRIQPTVFMNELKSLGVMAGVQVVCFLWLELIPIQFSPPMVKWLSDLGEKHILKTDFLACLPFLALGLSAWDGPDGPVGIPVGHVHTIDMILIVLYCILPTVVVTKACLSVGHLAIEGDKEKHEAYGRSTLYKIFSSTIYKDQKKKLKSLIMKLRVSLFLIVFCASGGAGLSIFMIPFEMGHVFRFHPEIWLTLMFCIGHLWNAGMLYLFKPKSHTSNSQVASSPSSQSTLESQ